MASKSGVYARAFAAMLLLSACVESQGSKSAEHDSIETSNPPPDSTAPLDTSGDAAVDDQNVGSCGGCEVARVSWIQTGIEDATIFYSIDDCTTLTISGSYHNFSGGPDLQMWCETQLPCASSLGVQSALGDPAVRAALADNAKIGASPNDGWMIRTDEGSLFIGGDACGNDASCKAVPKGVLALSKLLKGITAKPLCTPQLLPATDCGMPFDPGTGSKIVATYAFDSAIGTCVPQIYTGTGGNTNRFESMASCRVACPTTASAESCPTNRKFVAETCIACGMLPGGCDDTTPACKKLCTTTADCAPEVGTCGADGVCELSGCI